MPAERLKIVAIVACSDKETLKLFDILFTIQIDMLFYVYWIFRVLSRKLVLLPIWLNFFLCSLLILSMAESYVEWETVAAVASNFTGEPLVVMLDKICGLYLLFIRAMFQKLTHKLVSLKNWKSKVAGMKGFVWLFGWAMVSFVHSLRYTFTLQYDTFTFYDIVNSNKIFTKFSSMVLYIEAYIKVTFCDIRYSYLISYRDREYFQA